jgi:hypothetical protein
MKNEKRFREALNILIDETAEAIILEDRKDKVKSKLLAFSLDFNKLMVEDSRERV